MNFISYEFIVFFAVVAGLYAVLGHRGQNRMLLVASYVFYGWWDWRFLGLLLISSVVDFTCGQIVDPKRENPLPDARRKLGLALSICVNLGILGFFKYFDFFSASFQRAAALSGLELSPTTLNIVLPVGISFYTFQTMSYTWDVYRGQLRATDRLLDFMLYVSFFPQLVAGPIERGVHLLPQMLSPRIVRREQIYSGAQLALWGFFKKMVIADGLAVIVDETFSQTTPDGPSTILACYAFAFQILCDFSGYTDIARGIARMLGFDICVNFRLPYFATNPSDFWQRWHISLSSWLRDYLYIPLGGNRGTRWLTQRNLLITMLLGGLWHGAAWHFILWGAFHGAILILFRAFQSEQDAWDVTVRVRKGLRFWLSVIAFFQLTCIGWLIFRVRSVAQIGRIAQNFLETLTMENVDKADLGVFLTLTAPFVLFQIYQYYRDDMEPWRTWPLFVRVPFYLFLIYGIMLLGAPETNAFIYFQF